MKWHFRCRQMGPSVKRESHRWVAWCAKTTALGEGPLDVDWALDDVFFEYGPTEHEALRKLKAEVLANGP